MKKTNRLQLLVCMTLVCLLGAGCATGPDSTADLKQANDRNTMMSQELEHSQTENEQLQNSNNELVTELQDKNVELVTIRNYGDEQHKAIKKRDEVVQTLSNQLKLEKKRRADKEKELKKLLAQKRTVQITKATKKKKGKFHLRIISLPDRERFQKYVEKLQGHLAKKDISNAVARKSGRFWVVDIGFFSSYKDSEAKDLRSKMRNFKYEGIRQFKDCLYVKY